MKPQFIPAPDYVMVPGQDDPFGKRFPGGLWLKETDGEWGLWGLTANGYYDYVGEWRVTKAEAEKLRNQARSHE